MPAAATCIRTTFQTSESHRVPHTGDMVVAIWPGIPMLEICTVAGRPCLLAGEDFGRFIAWISEQGYVLPPSTLPEPPAVLIHGSTCIKVEHKSWVKWNHDSTDDTPYTVDGVTRCGRCHSLLP